MIMRRKIVILSLIATVILSGCGGNINESADVIVEVAATSTDKPQVIVVERGNLEVAASFDAQVGPKVIQLGFPDEGIFGEYKVGLGDVVKKGDILAVPDTESIEEQLEALEKEIDNYIYDYNYQKTSYEYQIGIIKYQLQDVYDEIEEIEDEKYGT